MSPPSWLPVALQPVFTRLTTLTPGVALMVGLAAVFYGGSMWRVVSVGSGLLLGGWAGHQVGPWAGDPRIGWVAAVALGLGAAVLFYLVERVAVAGLGGAVFVELAGWAWPLIKGVPPDVVVYGAAAIVGAAIAALLHTRAIRALSAVAGAALVAWSVGYPGNPALIATVGVIGALWQSRGSKPKKSKR